MSERRSTIAAMVLNDQGDLLPYTCQSTKERCEENAAETLPGWSRMKELGARVVQVQVVCIETEM
jgi:hypothetical protein